MTDIPIPEQDLNNVMNDIIDIRSNPTSMIERFNIVLYSLKGFKKNEATVFFIENLIEELAKLEPLPQMKIDPFLGTIAKKILNASEKLKINADKLSEHQINEIVKPYIKNYGHFNVLYDTHSSSTKFLTKSVLKDDVQKMGFDAPNITKIFDENVTTIGAGGRLVGKTGYYVIVMVDKYEKFEERTDINEKELKDIQQIFSMIDANKDDIITPDEFNQIANKTSVKFSWPGIAGFGKLLFRKDPKKGVTLNDFIDTIILYGSQNGNSQKGSSQNDDWIRRIFDLYCDNYENDTISLEGLKKLANELEAEPYKGELNLLYKFAVDKNSVISFNEFRDHMKNEVKKGNIKIPKNL